MTMMTMLLVMVAGSFGAVCRAVVAHAVAMRLPSHMPWGTLAVNLIGSFALGALFVTASRLGWPSSATAALGAGFLGAFTTFSTWMYETVRLIEEHHVRVAMLNIIGPLVIGPPVVLLGAHGAGWALNVLI
jgi:fluoride exporter